jgi:predicted transposase YdaD
MVLLIPRRIKQLKDEGRDEGREEGRAEGRRELQQEWVAWNERRKAAEREGRPFDESPPEEPSGENTKK